jgi:hypothetical protein
MTPAVITTLRVQLKIIVNHRCGRSHFLPKIITGCARRTITHVPSLLACLLLQQRLLISHRLSTPHTFAMSHPYTNNWRPPHDDRPRYQSSWSMKPNSRRPQKDWSEINNQADDQVAPRHAAVSIRSLERWALATSNFPQQGHRHNEAQIIDRIQQRYDSSNGNRDASMPQYSNPNALESVDEIPPSHELMHGGAVKRRHSVSPPLSGRDQGSTKRQRTRSPPPPARFSNKSASRAGQVTIDLTEDDNDDYAQSSEWSVPSGDHGDQEDIVDVT